MEITFTPLKFVSSLKLYYTAEMIEDQSFRAKLRETASIFSRAESRVQVDFSSARKRDKRIDFPDAVVASPKATYSQLSSAICLTLLRLFHIEISTSGASNGARLNNVARRLLLRRARRFSRRENTRAVGEGSRAPLWKTSNTRDARISAKNRRGTSAILLVTYAFTLVACALVLTHVHVYDYDAR